MKKIIFNNIKIILAGIIFSLGIGIAYAWTGPSTTPPDGNSDTPLNVGANSQIKSGGLWVGSLGIDNGLRILNGNVGVGTTIPTAYLDIRSPVGITDPLIALFKSDQHGLGVQIKSHSTYSEISTNNTSYPLVINPNGGNIGIGTTNPTSKLHISNNGDVQVSLSGSVTGNKSKIYFDHYGYADAYISMGQAGNGILTISQSDGGTDGIAINTAGNVGIGTVNPGAKLQIDTPSIGNGEVRINSSGSESSLGLYSSGDDWVAGVGGWGNNNKYVIGPFTSSPGPKLTLDTSGNLSIFSNIYLGTSVSGSTASPSFINLGTNYSNGTTKDKLKIYLYNGGGGEQYGFGVGSAGDIQYHSNAYHDFYINNGLSLRIVSNGSVAIGTTDPQNFGLRIVRSGGAGTLKVENAANSDAITAYSGSSMGVRSRGGTYDFFAEGPGVDYGSASSIRWKNNIEPINNALDKVSELRGVYFNWDKEHGGMHDMGMIAEEVGKVVPEIVSYEQNGKDAIGIDYGHLTPILVNAIKELDAKNKNLENRIKILEEKLK